MATKEKEPKIKNPRKPKRFDGDQSNTFRNYLEMRKQLTNPNLSPEERNKLTEFFKKMDVYFKFVGLYED